MSQYVIWINNLEQEEKYKSDFTTVLNQGLPFDEMVDQTWTVSLGEIIFYPHFWATFQKGADLAILNVDRKLKLSSQLRSVYFQRWTWIDSTEPASKYYQERIKLTSYLQEEYISHSVTPGDASNVPKPWDMKTQYNKLKLYRYVDVETVIEQFDDHGIKQRKNVRYVVLDVFESCYNPDNRYAFYKFEDILYDKMGYTGANCYSAEVLAPALIPTDQPYQKQIHFDVGIQTDEVKIIEYINAMLYAAFLANDILYLYDTEMQNKILKESPVKFVIGRDKKLTLEFRHSLPNTWINFHPTLQYQLGRTEFKRVDFGSIFFNKSLKFAYTPQLSKPLIKNLYIFTDIIEEMMVNNKKLPLLRHVPVTNPSFCHSVFLPMFHMVHRKRISQIRVWITGDPWEESKLLKSDIYLKLVFDRIN